MNDLQATPSPRDDALRQSLAAGQDTAVAQLFHAAGAARPRVIWSPRPPDLIDPRHRAFLRHCQSLAGPYGLPPAEGFADRLPDLLRTSLILVSLGPDGVPQYDYFGDEVADQFGARLSGPMPGQMADHVERFYTAVFDVSAASRATVLTEHEPPGHVFVQAWHRLVQPLCDADGGVTSFAVLNVAENPLRSGLDAVHVPVFVLSADQQVIYANPPARLLMSRGNARVRGGDFFDETGISLPADLPTAEDLLGRGAIETRRGLVLRDMLLGEAIVTISAVMHRNRACYVTIVRPVE